MSLLGEGRACLFSPPSVLAPPIGRAQQPEDKETLKTSPAGRRFGLLDDVHVKATSLRLLGEEVR